MIGDFIVWGTVGVVTLLAAWVAIEAWDRLGP